jgi:hypothetical protein
MGDILGIFNLDPRVPTNCWHRLPASRMTEGNGLVYVKTNLQSLWVDYQLPVPDLLDPTLVGSANEAALMAVTLPGRFRMTLAFRGAGRLLAEENPVLSNSFLGMAEQELGRQAANCGMFKPWWRTEARPGGEDGFCW